MTLSNIIQFIWSCSKIYLFWIVIHYISVHAYVYLCTPATIWGFITSPFYVMAPQCIALDWAYLHSRNITYHMWIVLGTWLSVRILGSLSITNYNSNNNSNNSNNNNNSNNSNNNSNINSDSDN